jgi:putative ABC transport system permease protein
MNPISQVLSVAKFGLLSMPQRRGSVAAALFGIAGVVTVLVGVLSIANGFKAVMTKSGAADAAIVLRAGADNEMSSGLGRDDVRLVADAPGVRRGPDGALASPELFVIIDIPLKEDTTSSANVPLRGLGKVGVQVRDNFKMVEGRVFEGGKNEVIVGIGAAREFAGLELGKVLKVGRTEWTVVGHFTTGGSSAESEIWTDAAVLQAAYERGDSFQSVAVKLNSAGSFQEFKDALTSDPKLNVKVQRQTEYYEGQSKMLSDMITSVGYTVALLMAIGAIFGALNTMYNSVGARTREIATLRALGFGRGAVLVAIMLESIVLAIVGGAVGALVAYLVFNGFHASTINWQSFSQVTFAFAVTPDLLIQGISLATIIGLFGGFLPALRAARLPIATALREM